MFAPEVINYKRWLNCDNGWNGTMVETERGKELLDELYRILSPMKAMGPDDNKRFWIRVARGCADDSWSYDEMLEDGDVMVPCPDYGLLWLQGGHFAISLHT